MTPSNDDFKQVLAEVSHRSAREVLICMSPVDARTYELDEALVFSN